MSEPIYVVDELVLVCAFRYALGRMTYMPGVVAECLRKNARELPNGTVDLIDRKITEAEARGGLGMDCDKRTWTELRNEMVREKARRLSAVEYRELVDKAWSGPSLSGVGRN